MSDRSPLTAIASVLLVISAVTGHYVIGNRLQTMRPARGQHWSLDVPHGQSINARLWQDPLGAIVASGRDARGLRDHLSRRLQTWFDEAPSRENANENRALHILPVMIPSGSYVEESELRRRYRVAIVSALMSADYVPESTEHIGAFNFKHTDSSGAAEATPIAYEWFHRSKVDGEHGRDQPHDVLVMWLPERALAGSVLDTMEQIVATPLEWYAHDSGARDQAITHIGERVAVRVIGPSSSDGLAAMVANCKRRWRLTQRVLKEEKEIAAEIRRQAMKAFQLDLRDAPDLVKDINETDEVALVISKAIDAIRTAAAHRRSESNSLNAPMQQQNVSTYGATIVDEALFVHLWKEYFGGAKQEVTAALRWPWQGWGDPSLTIEAAEKAKASADAATTKRRNRIVSALAPAYKMYSPRATVPDIHLLCRAGLATQHESIAGMFKKWRQMPFMRTICSDDNLAERALQELELRGVRTARQDDRIALIVERDTIYGRTIERTFETELAKLMEQRNVASDTSAGGLDGMAQARIEVFS